MFAKPNMFFLRTREVNFCINFLHDSMCLCRYTFACTYVRIYEYQT